MKRFLGRLAGVAIGSLAGPVGAVFGFLAGWLVDQFRHSLGPWWRLERFLTDPGRERRWEYVEYWGTAALLVDVLCADGPPRVVQVEHALREPWPRSTGSPRSTRSPRRRGAFSPRSVIDSCLREHPRIHRRAIMDTLAAADDAWKSQLMELLVSVACADSEGMSSAELRVIQNVAEEFSVAVPRWAGLDLHSCAILGVEANADEATVRRAFRTLAAELHPDTGANLEPEQQRTMEDAFVRIRQAHDHLLSQIRQRG